jgi:hypothetical protein
LIKFVKCKALIGPVIVIIGGIYSLIVAVIEMVDLNSILGLSAIIPHIVIISLGIPSLILGILALISIKFTNYIAVVLGLIGVIYLSTIPLPVPPIPYYYYPLMWIGPPLVLVGGIIGVVISLVIKE